MSELPEINFPGLNRKQRRALKSHLNKLFTKGIQNNSANLNISLSTKTVVQLVRGEIIIREDEYTS